MRKINRSFTVDERLWLKFKSACLKRGMSASSVLNYMMYNFCHYSPLKNQRLEKAIKTMFEIERMESNEK